mmetsp:Transcript_15204/g.43091  ORF Transcript_15204/g.43091 Transcript_15204/m.43091 type:complete len:214 (+) Transcript_15204:939-1580(+)
MKRRSQAAVPEGALLEVRPCLFENLVQLWRSGDNAGYSHLVRQRCRWRGIGDGGEGGIAGAGAEEAEARRGDQERGDQAAATSTPSAPHFLLQTDVDVGGHGMPCAWQALPQCDHLNGWQRIRLPQRSRAQKQVRDDIRDQVSPEGKNPLHELRTGAVPLKRLAQLPTKVVVHLCHGAEETPSGALAAAGEELPMIEDVAAQEIHASHLVLPN